jgi:hypothetical protein
MSSDINQYVTKSNEIVNFNLFSHIIESFNHLSDLKTLNAIFSMFLVALFVSIYEVMLYYYVVVPQLKNNINNNINNVCDILKNKNISLSINNIVDKILTKIYESNEKIIINLQDKIINNININVDNLKNDIKEMIIKEIKNDISNNLKIEQFNQDNHEQNDEEPIFVDREYTDRFNMPASEILFKSIVKVLNNNNIDVNENLYNYIKLIIETNVDKKIYNLLSTLNNDEKHIINISNDHTYVLTFFIIFTIILILIILYILINNKNSNKGVDKCVYLYSIIIIAAIITFQINFYFFGTKYKYLGSFGDEELMIFLLSKY